MVIINCIVWLAVAMWMVLAAPAINTDRYEGDSCPLADGAGMGVCRHHASCLSLKTTPQKDWVTCSFDRDQPIVCCQNTTNTVGGSAISKLGTVLVQRSSSIAERMCDSFPPTSALTNHIFNGIEAALNEFPHMAALGYPAKGEETPFRCGASLISSRFLLTAAHCLSPQKPTYARLGVVKLIDYDTNDPPVDVVIEQTFIHPNYTGRPLKNDIALLLLNRTITENFLHPACLFTNYTDPDSDTFLTIAGWGSTDPNDVSTSPILLKANVTTLLRDTCNSTLAQNKSGRRSPNELQESQLCALGRNAQNETTGDTCVGDSGGPLELVDGRRRYIVGVTSSGKLCGSRWPGIYTRVSRYLDWIESIVWPAGGVIPH
ncbi:serine protease persephone-like [Culex pipiens pallens]|uniref:serine protease persephone-like n=1 Tax=Culex pipiens pallens TaxID=42434 RepID=UPI001952FBD1|nr:serine protease persephone-like [Culex pipiens pallens]